MHEQKAIVFYNDKVAGYLSKVDGKYFFKYDIDQCTANNYKA